MDSRDISGYWHGIQDDELENPKFGLKVTFKQSASLIEGKLLKNEAWSYGSGEPVGATIWGSNNQSDGAVTPGLENAERPIQFGVEYFGREEGRRERFEGELSPDGKTIEGTWCDEFNRLLSGSFLLQRTKPPAQMQENRELATIDAGVGGPKAFWRTDPQ